MTGFIFLAIIIAIFIFVKTASDKNHKNARPSAQARSKSNGYDVQNLPASMPDDQQAELRKIAEYCDVRFVTSKEIRKYTIHRMNEDFQALDGWKEWDGSIHEAPGQYERMGRAAQGNIAILAYDSHCKIAKMSGSSGKAYLTSYKHCSCPDFRERHLPCKHMYALRMGLENDNVPIQNKDIGIFRGLYIALAGRFGAKDDSNGIRAYINANNGTWQDSITRETAALICGAGASAAKIQSAKNNQIDIFSEEEFRGLFM